MVSSALQEDDQASQEGANGPAAASDDDDNNDHDDADRSPSRVDTVEHPSPIGAETVLDTTESGDVSDMTELEPHINWHQHFYQDVDGHLGIYRDYHDEMTRLQGHRLWTCHWQRFKSPMGLSRGSTPQLILTTAEGEDFYLDDLTYYPGANNWADYDDDDDDDDCPPSCVDMVEHPSPIEAETAPDATESDDVSDITEQEPPVNWHQHFFEDVDGHLGIYRDYHDEMTRLQGHRLWTCHWQRFESPVGLSRGSTPQLLLTTAEGQDFYLDDLTYYPGASNWADYDDDDEEF